MHSVPLVARGDSKQEQHGGEESGEKTVPKPKRNPAFKINLDLRIIKGLKLSQMPVGFDTQGKLVFGPNPPVDGGGKRVGPAVPSYIIWDSHQSAPPGFGIRVAGKRTYIIRRKVLGRSIMPTVGNFADFLSIDDARKKAAVFALKMVETGKNPNEEARRVAANELTLGMCFDLYREHLTIRTQKPAKPETLKVVKRVVKQFEEWGWLNRKVKSVAPTASGKA